MVSYEDVGEGRKKIRINFVIHYDAVCSIDPGGGTGGEEVGWASRIDSPLEEARLREGASTSMDRSIRRCVRFSPAWSSRMILGRASRSNSRNM